MIFGTVENIVLDDKDSEKLYKIYVATTTGLTGNTIEAYPLDMHHNGMGAWPRSGVHGNLTPAKYIGPMSPASRSASAATIALSFK